MNSFVTLLYTVSFFIICTNAPDAQAAESTNNDNISNYLVNLSAGAVSAGGIVGLTGTAITDIQSAQELVLSIKTLASGSSKNGYGLAITPARTNILPLKGADYKSSDWMRLWGATTLSYAENTADISGTTYRKSAASIDATYYLSKEDDPIIKAAELFSHGPGACLDRRIKDDELSTFIGLHSEQELNSDENKLKLVAMRQATVDAWDKCLNSEANKAKWNASKLSISFGAGWIKSDVASRNNQSLGRIMALGGIFGLGANSAAYFSLRRTTGELDLITISTSPTFKNSTLAAIRLTQGSADSSDLKWLIEASNAKASSVTSSNSAYQTAVGLDKRITPNIWLEFRYGRKRMEDSTTTQNASLLNLSWSPTSNLYGSK